MITDLFACRFLVTNRNQIKLKNYDFYELYLHGFGIILRNPILQDKSILNLWTVLKTRNLELSLPLLPQYCQFPHGNSLPYGFLFVSL